MLDLHDSRRGSFTKLPNVSASYAYVDGSMEKYATAPLDPVLVYAPNSVAIRLNHTFSWREPTGELCPITVQYYRPCWQRLGHIDRAMRGTYRF